MPTSTDSRRPDTGYLTVQGLTAGDGAAPVINDISLTVAEGEVVTVIGPNGAGKSTLLKCLTGRLRPQAGQVLLDGHDVTAASGNALTKGGLGYVPQHNDIFPTLTVRENLEMGGYLLPKAQVGARIDHVLQTFPSLRPLLKRSGKLLSGGERKLLGIGRCLISSPKLLILDEPTAGLSPILARSILNDHVTSLARAGVTILLVEQRPAGARGSPTPPSPVARAPRPCPARFDPRATTCLPLVASGRVAVLRTMIRHMVLLGALGAGAFGGRQRGDGFQLRLVLERGKLTLANRKSRIMRRRVATHNVRANAPVTRFRVRADSEPCPSQ